MGIKIMKHAFLFLVASVIVAVQPDPEPPALTEPLCDVSLFTRNGGKLVGKLLGPTNFSLFTTNSQASSWTLDVTKIDEIWFDIGCRTRVKAPSIRDVEYEGICNGNHVLTIKTGDGKITEVYLTECKHLVNTSKKE